MKRHLRTHWSPSLHDSGKDGIDRRIAGVRSRWGVLRLQQIQATETLPNSLDGTRRSAPCRGPRALDHSFHRSMIGSGRCVDGPAFRRPVRTAVRRCRSREPKPGRPGATSARIPRTLRARIARMRSASDSLARTGAVPRRDGPQSPPILPSGIPERWGWRLAVAGAGSNSLARKMEAGVGGGRRIRRAVRATPLDRPDAMRNPEGGQVACTRRDRAPGLASAPVPADPVGLAHDGGPAGAVDRAVDAPAPGQARVRSLADRSCGNLRNVADLKGKGPDPHFALQSGSPQRDRVVFAVCRGGIQ